MRVNTVVLFLWCTERWSWSEFSYSLTCGMLFLSLFGMGVFMGVCVFMCMFIMCVFVSSVLAAVLLMVLAVLAMLFHQLLSVGDLVDGVLRILAVFETEVMRVQNDLL